MDGLDAVILEKASKANPFWFNAVVKSAAVMVERRAKYSGEYHPYFNFVVMYYLTKENNPAITMHDIFRGYVNLKDARLLATTTDFPDEGLLDTVIDNGNYNYLEAGWIMGNLSPELILPPQQWEAIRSNRIYFIKMLRNVLEEWDLAVLDVS